MCQICSRKLLSQKMVFKEIKNYAAISKCAQQMCSRKSFPNEAHPGTDLSHAITPPCKLLCQSTHKSLIYSICCKFFILVLICCKRLQQPLFFIFKNFPHISQVISWIIWTQLLLETSTRFVYTRITYWALVDSFFLFTIWLSLRLPIWRVWHIHIWNVGWGYPGVHLGPLFMMFMVWM